MTNSVQDVTWVRLLVSTKMRVLWTKDEMAVMDCPAVVRIDTGMSYPKLGTSYACPHSHTEVRRQFLHCPQSSPYNYQEELLSLQ